MQQHLQRFWRCTWREQQRTGPEARHQEALHAARDSRRVRGQRLQHGRHVNHLVSRQPRRVAATSAGLEVRVAVHRVPNPAMRLNCCGFNTALDE